MLADGVYNGLVSRNARRDIGGQCLLRKPHEPKLADHHLSVDGITLSKEKNGNGQTRMCKKP